MAAERQRRLDWHPEAIAELAESLVWYAERNPAAARRMRREIEAAALSLIARPLAVPGRPGAIAGTRELPVGRRVPFTLIFVRDATTGDCTIYHCMHQRRSYPGGGGE
jgi:plasmid stabilization system protein ParE